MFRFHKSFFCRLLWGKEEVREETGARIEEGSFSGGVKESTEIRHRLPGRLILA
jgi:hypothetical protein